MRRLTQIEGYMLVGRTRRLAERDHGASGLQQRSQLCSDFPIGTTRTEWSLKLGSCREKGAALFHSRKWRARCVIDFCRMVGVSEAIVCKHRPESVVSGWGRRRISALLISKY
jgi:hypothetical protein